MWEAIGVERRPTKMLRDAPTIEESIEFAAPTESADVADDYASMGLTLRRHPLALLRPKLTSSSRSGTSGRRTTCAVAPGQGAGACKQHRDAPPHGQRRELRDAETGTVNIIVWPRIAQAQRAALRGSMLLSVQGTWQSEKGVHSLIAQRLVNHDELLGRLRVSSRDFR